VGVADMAKVNGRKQRNKTSTAHMGKTE